MMKFHDRQDAGRKLAEELRHYTHERPIVLALPRGGVPVGLEVARALSAPLDVWVVRKIGVPWQPELAMGAVAEGDFVYIASEMTRRLGIAREEIAAATNKKRREVEERVQRFRGDRPRPDLEARTVIVVDDGIATSATARAAVGSVRAQHPVEVVLAVPVAAPQSVRALASEVDALEALLMPEELYAIGYWYEDFTQVSDEEVVEILERRRLELAEEDLHDSKRGGQHGAR